MSPTIGLPPPPAENCLETSRKSRYRGGTLVAEDVHDLVEHKRLADADLYRRLPCPGCEGAAVHVHTRPERHPRGEPSLPPAVPVLQFRCADCGATWRILLLFLARHLWHAWKAVERAVATSPSPPASSNAPAIRAHTRQRWLRRLLSSARMLVAVLAASGGAALEEVAKRVGLSGTRAELVDAHAAVAMPPPGERLASLGALVHRLERGLRLM